MAIPTRRSPAPPGQANSVGHTHTAFSTETFLDELAHAAVLRCTACHQATNDDVVGMPGHPNWHLAPASIAWQGKSLAEICAQVKDPVRNGGNTGAEIVEHVTHDSLVGWGWSPDVGREPAPGTQEVFGALSKAWAGTGAVCPGG
jgi:CO/xanthine dehydrogenase Mo-binding subunit